MLAGCIIDGVPIRLLHEIEAMLPRIRLDDVVATSPTHTPTQLDVINQLHQGGSAGNNVTTGDDQAGNTILDDPAGPSASLTTAGSPQAPASIIATPKDSESRVDRAAKMSKLPKASLTSE